MEMTTPAQSILIVYDINSGQVRSWIVPDFEYQITDKAHVDANVRPELNETSCLMPLADYKTNKMQLPDIQYYILNTFGPFKDTFDNGPLNDPVPFTPTDKTTFLERAAAKLANDG